VARDIVSPRRTTTLGDSTAEPGDSLERYLADIAKIPLLTWEEEQALGRRIRATGDQGAVDALVQANTRFVVSTAKKYQGQGLELLDLIGAGNLGLITAAAKFDPDQGVKFISYAVWWIRQAILASLADNGRVVRVPLNRTGELHRVSKVTMALSQELGRAPTTAEIAQAMQRPEGKVGELIGLAQPAKSLDTRIGDDNDLTLLDGLADPDGATSDEVVIANSVTETIEEALARLNPRSRKILRLYFGLDGERPQTLEEIGAMIGVTRERVRQLKEKALAQLRGVRTLRASLDADQDTDLAS